MTPNDAISLISLCDRAIDDLKELDRGTDYKLLQIATTFRTIVEPLLEGSEVVPELRRTHPATGLWRLKTDLGRLKNASIFSVGQGIISYGESVLNIKMAIESYLNSSVGSNGSKQMTSNSDFVQDRQTNSPKFEDLLHPNIVEHALPQFRDGHIRDAVLNGVIAVFDMIRARTGLKLDGKALVGQAFGLEKGKLIFSEIDTETGKNDQLGFMHIYEGIYTGIRNVKAHSLSHDLNEQKAAQYLVTLSLLAQRVDECIER